MRSSPDTQSFMFQIDMKIYQFLVHCTLIGHPVQKIFYLSEMFCLDKHENL